MCCGVQHDLDQITFFELRTSNSAAATTLGAELVGWGGLDVTTIGQREDKFFVVDQVFDIEFTRIDGESGATVVRVAITDFGQFG